MFEHMESVKFSELLCHNSEVPILESPNGLTVAVAAQYQLHIWDVDSKKVIQRFKCENVIDFMQWSANSELICCGALKESIQIFNLKNPYWICKLNEESLSADKVYWAPDSFHILLISEFSIKLTIFSLASSLVAEIDNLKTIENAASFSSCKKYLAVAHRVNFEDHIGVYSCDSWETLKTKVYFYSIDGRLLGKYCTNAYFAPIIISWNHFGNYVALGDCFGEVTVLNCMNFEKKSSHQLPEIITEEDIAVYKTSVKCNGDPEKSISSWEIDELVKSRPFSVSLPMVSSDKQKGKLLKTGIQILEFSTCGRYIASVNGNTPKVLCIYDLTKSKVCDVFIQNRDIKCVSWHPEKSFLIFCTGSSTLHMWTPHCCIQYMAPFKSDFSITNVTWSKKKDCIILNSKDQASILYLP
ncbi:WD repeat-containing protein WRAP73-like isoform X2 [Uloborus diversus]|uniref:WD repeat-containing protein WRAP73-like isoform X2 n=1 Tax=Uloborus diversus TaxID=327109 RepID=UPI00240A9724|nr:WD repeat-containing protein WRAP73-like isoform X2 [Uloborus diversus]